MQLSAINVYPVKSCAGIALREWEVDTFGLRYDRRWMVVTPDGQFVTQRECPALALVSTEIRPPHLRLTAPEMPELILPLEPMGGRPLLVRVWRDRVMAVAPDHKADDWFSQVVGQECILAYMPEGVVRPVDTSWAPDGGRTGFADAFSFLLLSEASLEELNRRLETPLTMNRFRPNLVVAGAEPFAEDGWRHFAIGGIPMQAVKPCARCVMTTIDQATGRRAGDEPLQTLATFRRMDNKVMFGQNVMHYGTGRLRVGDPVVVGD